MRFCVDVFHESLAFAALGEGPSRAGEWTEGIFKELIHAFDRLDEVMEFPLKDFDGVFYNRFKRDLKREIALTRVAFHFYHHFQYY